MAKLPIVMACGAYDRVQALANGEVAVAGCDVTVLNMGPEELFFRAFRGAEFDVCELSFSSYLVACETGSSPYIAIPVFPSRMFRHSAIYVRADRGIDSPRDLKGKNVGVPEYQMTAALWVRGLLEDEYGVSPADLRWHAGGLHEPNRKDKVKLTLPPSISLRSIDAEDTLDNLLVRGDLDALIAPRVPNSFARANPVVRRLFPNYGEMSKAYYQKTGLYPIMHVIGIRRSLVEKHAWLANSVFDAFDRAKEIALDALRDTTALKVSLPFLDAEMDETFALMGKDPWPYGVDPNRKTIETMLDYAHRHGTTERRLRVEEIFAPTTVERYKV
ncbi:MAG: ABC transporter substrate-binding protein [Terriglobales bacterium]